MLQGAVLLQTSHAWATRPQFGLQTSQARQSSSQCSAQHYEPDTRIPSFTWPQSVIRPLRLGCLSTWGSAHQDSSDSSSLSSPDSLPADQGVYQPIESGGCSIPSNPQTVQELQADINRCDRPESDASTAGLSSAWCDKQSANDAPANFPSPLL